MLHASVIPLCDSCRLELSAHSLGMCCHLCSEPMGYEPSFRQAGQILCEPCRTQKPNFARVTSFGPYELMRHGLRLFKFEEVRSLAKPLGALLAKAILAHAEEMPEHVLVVPVPMFRGRRGRFYNQSYLLARFALPVVRRQKPHWKMELAPLCMKRVHQKESQTRLSPEERRENVRGAFRVRGNVLGRHILLIDDVYTTGATSHECTEVLLAAGALSVRVSTLTRAGTQIPDRWTPPTAAMVSADYQTRTHPANPINPIPKRA